MVWIKTNNKISVSDLVTEEREIETIYSHASYFGKCLIKL